MLALQFKHQPLLSEIYLSFNSNGKNEISLNNSFFVTKPSLFFRSSHLSLPNLPSLSSSSLSNQTQTQTQTQKSIICARNNRRRSGSQRTRKFILETVDFVASNLHILPEPLGLVIREFGGGNGGGLRFWKGFGWGGFDGRRRKRNINLGLLGLLMVCGLGLYLILGKELDIDVFLGGLGLSLFGVSINGWKRGFKDWILGFCCCAVLVGVVLKREDLQKLAKGWRAMKIVSRRKRRRRAM
uniref:Transmembrane protein n=1 Tax=Davidia involucrata TaxID=16924 RepID=A0A5B7BDG4_DAVIN